jgi:hypothetical protein
MKQLGPVLYLYNIIKISLGLIRDIWVQLDASVEILGKF